METRYPHSHPFRDVIAIFTVLVAVFAAGAIAQDVGFGIAVVLVTVAVIGLIVPLLFIGDEQRSLPRDPHGRAT